LFSLGVLSRGPSLSLFDMLLVTGKGLGAWRFAPLRWFAPLWWFALLRWFICLLGLESFHFVPCFPPFFGALV
jgi:hypothetical protein